MYFKLIIIHFYDFFFNRPLLFILLLYSLVYLASYIEHLLLQL